MFSKQTLDKFLTCIVFILALIGAIGGIANKNLFKDILGETGAIVINVLLVIIVSYLVMNITINYFY
mgnify:CR=1 FL=1